MPGLFGVVNVCRDRRLNAESASALLNRMEERLRHRPDYHSDRWSIAEQGIYLGRIGHRNLMHVGWPSDGADQHETVSGVMYGVEEARSMHPKYEKFQGTSRSELKGVKGCYSFVMTQPKSNSILVVADKRGSEPVYYVEHNGNLYFGPEVKAVLLALDATPAPDNAAIAMFLGAGHLLADQTMFSSVRRLPGGHAIYIQDGRLNVHEHWNYYPSSSVINTNKNELAQELGGLVARSVAKHFGTTDETITFLSGGADSRGILGGALEKVKGKGNVIHTVCWGVDRDAPGSDPVIADSLAKRFKLRHEFLARETTEYGNWFEEVNFLIDGMCDVSAFHPHEFQLMKKLRSSGFNRVLRGDECFGWHGRVFDLQGAFAAVGIHRFRNIKGPERILHKNFYDEVSRAGDGVFDNLVECCDGMEANDAKDYLYFNHRLQTYINLAGYYKQVVFDQRNPLLDDDILDWLPRVPRQLRFDKALFIEAMRSRYPDLMSLPFAVKSGLENWSIELNYQSNLRRYLESELSDKTSGIWDYFDRAKAINILDSVRAGSSISGTRNQRRSNLKYKVRHILDKRFPKMFSYAQAVRKHRKRHFRQLENHRVLMRLLVLKNWHDRFVSGK